MQHRHEEESALLRSLLSHLTYLALRELHLQELGLLLLGVKGLPQDKSWSKHRVHL